MPLPSDLTGLQLWLKADAIVGKVDGDAISTWSDSSGNSKDATQATGVNQPIYKTNILNGLPVLRLNGSQWMAQATFAVSQPITVFAVAKQTSNSTNASVFSASDANENTLLFTTNTPNRLDLYGGTDLFGYTDLLGSFNVLTGVFNGASSINQVNGRPEALGNAGALNITTYRIGNNAGGSTLTGDIAEVIVYNRVLSTFERSQIDTYLSDKYRITVADYLAYSHRQLRIPNNKVGPMAMRRNFRQPAQTMYQADAPAAATTAQNNMTMLGVG